MKLKLLFLSMTLPEPWLLLSDCVILNSLTSNLYSISSISLPDYKKTMQNTLHFIKISFFYLRFGLWITFSNIVSTDQKSSIGIKFAHSFTLIIFRWFWIDLTRNLSHVFVNIGLFEWLFLPFAKWVIFLLDTLSHHFVFKLFKEAIDVILLVCLENVCFQLSKFWSEQVVIFYEKHF